MERFKNELIQEAYSNLLKTHTLAESNYILLNSLAVLGDKKIVVQNDESISESNIKRVNSYKYPDRLASFVNITSNKSEVWKQYSFCSIAFS